MRLLSNRILHTANKSARLVVCLACAIMAAPAAITGCAALQGSLGVNPLEILMREPGKWALILLLAALAIAPLRHLLMMLAQRRHWECGKRLPDWNWLMRLRRPVGLACFFYAAVHLALYLSLDLNFSWHEFTGDLRDKPYIVIGWMAFLLLLPLAVTSTNAWMRRLKRNWKRLHLLIYPVAVLAEIHFLLLSKPGITDPLPFGWVLIGLLGYRIMQRRPSGATSQERADGTAPERPIRQDAHKS